jgi:hypothetical protein
MATDIVSLQTILSTAYTSTMKKPRQVKHKQEGHSAMERNVAEAGGETDQPCLKLLPSKRGVDVLGLIV